jgi:hypothetical protein
MTILVYLLLLSTFSELNADDIFCLDGKIGLPISRARGVVENNGDLTKLFALTSFCLRR